MTTVPERDPAEWYTEHDSAVPSAAPEAEHRNGVTSIHTLLGSGFSRGTNGASVWGSGGPNGVWGSGLSPNGARSFFPRLSSLGRSESSPTRAIACAASSNSPSRSDEEGPSSSRSPSTSAPSEPVSLPSRLKRFARPEASDRPELAYLDVWTSREANQDEQGQELPPPTPPPRRSLSLGAAVAPKQPLTIAAAAEAEEVLRRVADEAAWKQALPEEAAGTGSPPRLRRASSSPPMSPTSPAMTTTVSGAAQRCVLQCGLELVIVLASFVDIDFLHQVQRRRLPQPPRTAARPPLRRPPAATAPAAIPSPSALSHFRQGWCRLRLTPHLEHAEGEAPYPATVMAHFRRRCPAPPSPAASQPHPAPPASRVAGYPPAACAALHPLGCAHVQARRRTSGARQQRAGQ